MRLLVYTLIFIVLPGILLAQKPEMPDSTFFFDQSQREFHLAFASSGFLLTEDVAGRGEAGIQAGHKEGSFRRPQEAYSTTVAALKARGFNTLGRFRVAARFTFNKVWEDSLANTLKGTEEDIRPVYYFVSKPGEYQRQNYQADGLLTYALKENRYYLALGLDYQTHWTTRSVDPRPDVKSFVLRLNPEFAYRMKESVLSAGLIWGYGNEDNSIDYKNRNYQYGLSEPERIYFLSRGYGSETRKDSSVLRRYADYFGWKLSYSLNKANWKLKALAQYLHTAEDNTRDIRYRKNYFLHSTFDLDEYQFNAIWSQAASKSDRQVALDVNLKDGSDWSRAYMAQNYGATDIDVRLLYSEVFHKWRKVRPGIAVSADYRQSERLDATKAHRLFYKYVQPRIDLNLYLGLSNGDRLSFGLSPSYRIALSTELSAPPTQVSNFTETIVYPDFYYFASRYRSLEAKAHYISRKIFRNYPAGLWVQAQGVRRGKLTETLPGIADDTGNRRLNLQFGFSIYL